LFSKEFNTMLPLKVLFDTAKIIDIIYDLAELSAFYH
jgi:hypothetical protein